MCRAGGVLWCVCRAGGNMFRAGGVCNMCRAGGMCAAHEVFCGVCAAQEVICAAQEVIMFRVGGLCGVCVCRSRFVLMGQPLLYI